jgi:hypothetical protein
MGGSGGMFGSSKQRAASPYKMTGLAKRSEADALKRQNDIASGKAQSVSQMQFNQNIDQANQQAMAMAASQRGASNPALAFRQAQLMNQQNTMAAAQQGAIMAEQERRMADDYIAKVAAGQRGVALQSALANQQADAQKSAADKQMLGSLASGAGAMAMASDENAKTNIKDAENPANAVEAFVKAIKPYMYEYKNSKHGTGEKMGVMAQDLEKSEVGKTMVDKAPDGTKIVDTNKALGPILAALADLNKKVEKLEK